jgi:hypothetical protein
MRATGWMVTLGVSALCYTGVAASELSPPPMVDPYVPPSHEETASIGCITAGTAAAILAGAFGAFTIPATGGASAGYATLVLPVLGTAFAAGCGIGLMAAPGAAWVLDHFEYLLGGRDEAPRGNVAAAVPAVAD